MCRLSYFRRPRFLSWLALLVISQVINAGEEKITLIAAGDVEWSGKWFNKGEGSIFLDPGDKVRAKGGWDPIPRLIAPESLAKLKERDPKVIERYESLNEEARRKAEAQSGVSADRVKAYYDSKKPHDLSFESDAEWAKYPFRKIGDIFRKADIAFVNLESPVSDNAPKVGAFLTPTIFTKGLNFAGIDLVSLANNHMLDGQIWGLYDTLDTLDKADVAHIGAGKDLAQARQPHIIEKKGIRIAFLAYAQKENSGASSFATPNRAGIAPLDPLLIEEDIKRIKGSVDHIILSFHWDLFQFDASKSFDLHTDAVDFAHQMIDAGADAILGHGPHIPRAVEYYKGKPILYSMAHLIFSIGLDSWVDNYVARLNITKDAIPSVEILPVAGIFEDLAQPYLLEGERAHKLLTRLQGLSKGMGGALKIDGNKGVLTAN